MKPVHWNRRLLLNHAYLYANGILHWFAGVLPEPLRGLVYRAVLKRVGTGVYFDSGVYFKFPRQVEIGSYVSINRGCEFYPSHFAKTIIRIGSNVRIGPHARFFGAGHDVEQPGFANKGGDIVVGDACWIGGNCTILPGISIGEGSVVAAGSVVTRDVPANCVVAGVPARVIRKRGAEA